MGFRGLGFGVQGFRGLGVRGLGLRAKGSSVFALYLKHFTDMLRYRDSGFRVEGGRGIQGLSWHLKLCLL